MAKLYFLGDYILSRENKPFKLFFFQGPGRLSEQGFLQIGLGTSKPYIKNPYKVDPKQKSNGGITGPL